MKSHACGRAVWQLLTAVLTPWLPAGHAQAADDECELDILTGQMEASLLEIANRCNVVVSLRPDLMAGRTTPAVRGRFTVRQAFGLALQPSGLQVATTTGGALTVQPVPAGSPPAAPTVPAAAPAASPAAGDMAASLPPVVVTGNAQDAELRATRAWSATRSSTPLAEQPQSVSMLTAEALDLQGGHSVTDTAFFVPGMVDGVADWKGRGGLVNLVLKEPGQGAHDAPSQTLSSRDSGTLHISRPWGGGGAWRLVGYGEQSGRTAGGYERNAAAGLLGSSTLRLGNFSGLLTLHAERHHDAPPPAAQGRSTLVDGVFVDLPALRLPRVPADPDDRHLFTSGAAHLTPRWALAPRWDLTVRALAEVFHNDLRRHQPHTAPMQRNGRSAGLDASRWRSDTKGVDFLTGEGPIRIAIRESKTALSLQDELSIGPLRLRLALQRARTPTHDEIWRDNLSGAIKQPNNFMPVSGTNWDAGLLYQTQPTLAVYAGTQRATEASQVLAGQVVDGMPIPPSITGQAQAGLKLGSADRRLAAKLEMFRIRQSAFKLSNYASTLLPGRISDGLELELTGRPHPRVDLSLGFSRLRTIDQVALGVRLVDSLASQFPQRSMHLLSSIRLGDVLWGRTTARASPSMPRRPPSSATRTTTRWPWACPAVGSWACRGTAPSAHGPARARSPMCSTSACSALPRTPDSSRCSRGATSA